MCGFVGEFLFRNGGKLLEVESMARIGNLLAHRGPDSEGHFHRAPFSFHHRRLAIIDLTSGDQPMVSRDGNLIVVYNGEIYNFKELRGMLLERGHEFDTNTDTEILVHRYEE